MRLRLILGIGISLLFVGLLVQSVDVHALTTALGHAQPAVLLPALALYFAGTWLRSVRWRLLLPPDSAPTTTLARALLIGLTVNNLLPARLGEAARAYVLNRWRGVPVGATVASVVVERVLDGLTLAMFLLVAVGTIASAPAYLMTVGLLVGGAFVAGACLLAAIVGQPRAVLATLRFATRPCPPRIQALAERLTLGFVNGLGLVHGWSMLFNLAFLSIAAWLLEIGVFYVLMFGFSFPASFSTAILGGSAANFATLVPSSPGYVGTFDGVLVKVISDVLGGLVEYEEVLAYALVTRLVLFLPVTLAGVALMSQEGLSFGDIVRFGATTKQTAARAGTGTRREAGRLGSPTFDIPAADAGG